MRSFFSHRRSLFRPNAAIPSVVHWAVPPMRLLRSRQSSAMLTMLSGASDAAAVPSSALLQQMVLMSQVTAFANYAMFVTCFTDLSMKNTWITTLVSEREAARV